jgi:hypothetical protein
MLSDLLVSPRAKKIQRKTAHTFLDASENLSPLIVGRNGSTVHDLERAADRLTKCGSSMLISAHAGAEKLEELRTCSQHKFCPLCSDIQYSRRKNRFNSQLPHFQKTAKFAYLVTFTLPPMQSVGLADKTELLNSAFRKFYLMGQKRTGRKKVRSGGESGKIEAALKSIELKRGAGGCWHPHIHAVVFTSEQLDYVVYDPKIKSEIYNEFGKLPKDKYVSEMKKRGGIYKTIDDRAVSKLSEEWYNSALSVGVVGAYGVDVDPIDISELKDYDGANSGVLSRVKYALKYTFKFDDFEKSNSKDIFEIWDALRGLRTVEYLGAVRIEKEESENERESEREEENELPEYLRVSTVIRENHYRKVDYDTGEIIDAVMCDDESEKVEEENPLEKIRVLLPDHQKNYKRMTSVIVGIYRKGRKKAFLVLVRGEDEERYIERVEELYRVMRARLERLREHRHSLCLLISGQSTTEGARAAVAHRSKMLMVREHFQFMHRRRAKMNRLLDSDFYILKD